MQNRYFKHRYIVFQYCPKAFESVKLSVSLCAKFCLFLSYYFIVPFILLNQLLRKCLGSVHKILVFASYFSKNPL